MREYLPPPEACGTCRFYGADPAIGWGACRRHAPAAVPEHGGLLRGWPIVFADDQCGDFERDPTERGFGPALPAKLPRLPDPPLASFEAALPAVAPHQAEGPIPAFP